MLVKNSWKCWSFVKIEFLDKILTFRIVWKYIYFNFFNLEYKCHERSFKSLFTNSIIFYYLTCRNTNHGRRWQWSSGCQKSALGRSRTRSCSSRSQTARLPQAARPGRRGPSSSPALPAGASSLWQDKIMFWKYFPLKWDRSDSRAVSFRFNKGKRVHVVDYCQALASNP